MTVTTPACREIIRSTAYKEWFAKQAAEAAEAATLLTLANEQKAAAEKELVDEKRRSDAERVRVAAEAKRINAEGIKREANEANRARVIREITEDLESFGEMHIVDAIVGDKIRNVKVVW